MRQPSIVNWNHSVSNCSASGGISWLAACRPSIFASTDWTVFNRSKQPNATSCFRLILMPGSFSPRVSASLSTCSVLLSEQSNYLRTLPLHATQQEIKRNEKESVFAYRLRPTFDFMQELRKYADAVEVLEPQWLRERILTDALSVCRLYGAADGTAASGVTADGESVGMHDRYSEGGRL